jgi:fibronectin type 3 domain-containing protein
VRGDVTRLLHIISFLFFLFFLSNAEAAYLDLAWDPNEELDLGGYRVYYGTTSGDYINFVDIGTATSYRLDNLLDDVTYYIALTAYDTAGNESDFSGEVSAIGLPDGDGDGPSAPLVDGEKGGGCFVSTVFRCS